MKNKLSLLSLILASFAISSCAGLISGETQNIFLRPTDGSENVEVEITTSNGNQNTNIPGNIVVPRNKAPLTITVKESKCHKESKTYATSRYNPFLLADVIGGVFGLTGTTTDMNSGAAWTYDDNIMVETRKKPGCKSND